jgi:hypothetical protein
MAYYSPKKGLLLLIFPVQRVAQSIHLPPTFKRSMRTDTAHEAAGTPVLRRYEGYGLLGGLAIGLLIGVLIAGPHFFEWPVGESLVAVFGSAALCAGIGWLALGIEVGTLARGGVAWDGTYGADISSGGGDCGGGGFGGGGGDCGGSDGGGACT